VDSNRKYNPAYPLESLFAAVSVCTPEFDFGNVDLVTDRNNLRKLARFAVNDPDLDSNFTINGLRIGDTMIFERVDPEDELPRYPGFGHDFEKKFTNNASGLIYHRVVSFTGLGGLKLVVRCEVDAVRANEGEEDVEILTRGLSGLKIPKKEAEFKVDFNKEDLKVKMKREGIFDKSSRLMELSTKSSKYAHTFEYSNAAFQMLLGGTDELAIGFHNRGFVASPVVKDIAELKVKLAKKLGTKFAALSAVLKDILQKTKDLAVDSPVSFQIAFNTRNRDALELTFVERAEHITPDHIKSSYFNKH